MAHIAAFLLVFLASSACQAVTLQFTGTYSTSRSDLYPNPQQCAQAVTLTASPNNADTKQPRKVWTAIGPQGLGWEVSCVEVKAGVYRWAACIDAGGAVVVQIMSDNTTTPTSPPSLSGMHPGSPQSLRAPVGVGPGNWSISP